MFMLELLSNAFILLVFASLIGLLQNKATEIRLSRKERFEKFYLPLANLHYAIKIKYEAHNFSDLETEEQNQYIDLIINFGEYSSDNLISLMALFKMVYHCAYLNNDASAKIKMNEVYIEFLQLGLNEYEYLRNKLYFTKWEKHKYNKIKNKLSNPIKRK